MSTRNQATTPASAQAADWFPASWRAHPAQQMPTYPNQAALAAAEERLRASPPWSSPAKPAA